MFDITRYGNWTSLELINVQLQSIRNQGLSLCSESVWDLNFLYSAKQSQRYVAVSMDSD
jgi:hypothetical protein